MATSSATVRGDETVLFSESAVHPWHLPMPLSGHGSGNYRDNDAVKINSEEVAKIWAMYREIGELNLAISKFIDYAIKGGIMINIDFRSGKARKNGAKGNDKEKSGKKKGKGKGKSEEVLGNGTFKFDTSSNVGRQYINDILLQVKQVILDFILFGYSRVRIVPFEPKSNSGSGRSSGAQETEVDKALQSKMGGKALNTFVRMRLSTTDEYIEWDKYERRSYKIYHKMRGGSYGAGGSLSGNAREVKGGRVLVYDEPDEDGTLMSRVALISRLLFYQDRLMLYYMKSAYSGATPPYIFSPSEAIDKNLKTGGPMSVPMAEASIFPTSESMREHSVSMNNVQYEMMLRRLGDASRKASMINNGISGSAPLGNRGTGLGSASPHYGAAGGGGTLQGPEGDSFSAFTKRGMGISGAGGVASKFLPRDLRDIEHTNAWDNSLIVPVGHKLQPFARPNYPEGFFDMRHSIVEMVCNAIGIPPKMIISGRTAGRYAGDNQVLLSQLRDSVRNLHSRIEPIISDLLREAWTASINSKVYNSAASKGKEKDARYLRKKLDSVQVEFKFKDNPIQEYEFLKMLYDDGVINAEGFQTHSLNISGLSEKYRQQNMEKVLIERTKKLAEATSAGKNANATGGVGAAKNPSATAATKSSNKTSTSSSQQQQNKTKSSDSSSSSSSSSYSASESSSTTKKSLSQGTKRKTMSSSSSSLGAGGEGKKKQKAK